MFWRKKRFASAIPSPAPQTEDDMRLRGVRAKRLLSDADFMAALVEIERDISGHMMATTYDQQELRETLHAEARALARIHYKLTEWADYNE